MCLYQINVKFVPGEIKSPQGTMVKPKASWKGLDRKYFLTSDPLKDVTRDL